MAFGAKFSSTASDHWISCRAISIPFASFRFNVMLFLPTLRELNRSPPSMPCGLFGPSA